MSSIDMHNVDKRPLLHKFLSEKDKMKPKKLSKPARV